MSLRFSLAAAVLAVLAAACATDAVTTTTTTTSVPPPSGVAPGETDRSSLSFVGLTTDAAADRAAAQNRPSRIVSMDGEPLIVTDDYVEDRLNFTVIDSIVTAAFTDAELATGGGADPVCPDTATDENGTEYQTLARYDLDGDGRDEVFGSATANEIRIWTRNPDDCSLIPVMLDGAPAVFPIGLSDSAASGLDCNPSYVDDLYVVALTSSDGETYGGRITGYNLAGTELVEASGEGAELGRADAAGLAVLHCG